MAGTIKHEWNGTILTITSDSGVSSCDLKGEKGDDGARGPQGVAGSVFVDDINLSADCKELARSNIDAYRAINETGDIITMEAEAALPLSVVSQIELKQEGSGEPSPTNIRNIVGYDTLTATVAGRNLFGGEALADRFEAVVSLTRDDVARTITYSASKMGSKIFFTDFKPNTQYTIILYGKNSKETAVVANLHIRYTDGTYQRLDFKTANENSYAVYTTTAGKTVEGLRGSYNDGSTTLYYDKCGIFEGILTEADFEEYNGETISAALPETVYSGIYEWETGKLTINKKCIVFTGSEGWSKHQTISNTVRMNTPTGAKTALLCSHYKVAPVADNDYSVNIGTQLNIHDSTNAIDTTTWKAYLAAQAAAGTPVKLICELKTPIETYISPAELETIEGVNNIWSNSGETTITNLKGNSAVIRYLLERIAELTNAIVSLGGNV